MVGLSRGLADLLALTATCGALAQSPPKFVAFDIVAEDARGDAVSGLQQSEIRLSDDRKAQTVVYCHSNQRHPDEPRPTVVVFNLAYAGAKSFAWNEAVRAMRQFETSGSLYFYVVTGSGAMLPVHELPAPDAESLPANRPWMEQSLKALEATLPLEPLQQDRTAMITVASYLQLAARMAVFPGRKNLICIGCLFAKSRDWEASPDAAHMARSVELSQLTDALLEARVAVHIVGGKPVSGRIGAGGGPGVGFPGGWPTLLDDIGAFAAVTGGRAYGFGQVADAIEQAVRDGKSSYRFAYLPLAGNWDAKRHKITIASGRRGVRLLAPGWYIAERQEGLPAIPQFAITSPFEQTDIGVSVSAAKKLDNALRIEIRVDAADLLLLPRNGRYSGSVMMQAICRTPDERRRACTEPAEVKLDLSPQEYHTAMRGGLRFPLDVPAREASSRIRAVVHDENSGLSGTATVAVNEER